MSCICCTKKLNLGCVTTCDVLTISYTVPATADYTLLVDFGEQLIEITATIDIGNELVFDISGLNQDYTHTAQVKDAAGVVLSFIDVDLNVYDCFIFQTIIGLTSNVPSINLTLAP